MDHKTEQRLLETWQPHIGPTPFDEDDEDWFTPQTVEECLDGIIGQDEAKRAVAMLFYELIEYKMPTTSLFIGQTGSGKTELFRQLRKEYSSMITIVDASHLSAEGWKGTVHIQDILKSIPAKNGLVKKHVLVLDEFDKIYYQRNSDTNFYDLIQGQLLKIFEHDFAFPDCINANDLAIVCCGAFSSIFEGRKTKQSIGFGSDIPSDDSDFDIRQELIDFGMLPELLARFDRIIIMNEPTIDTYIQIGRKEIEKLESDIHKEIKVSDGILREICQDALDMKLGGRYIRKQLLMRSEQKIYDDCYCDCIEI